MKKVLTWAGAAIVALVAVVLVANVAFVWSTDARLESQLKAIRDAGDPVALADLARPAVPSDKNAATYLRKAEPDVAAIVQETKDVRSAVQCPGFVLTPKDRQTVKASFAAHPKVMGLLQQAAACPEYEAPLDYTLPPDKFQENLAAVTRRIAGVARVLCRRVDMLVAEGNRNEAVRTAVLLLQLARHFDRNPTAAGHLAALAVREVAIQSANEALQTGPVARKVRDALDAELALQELADGYASMLKTERALGLDKTRRLPGRDFWLVQRGILNLGTSLYLDEMEAFLAVARSGSLSYSEADKALRQSQRADASPATEAFAKQVCVGVQATHLAATRVRAEIRALRALNAIQQANRKDAATLGQLGLPAEATVDPFNGESLRVKKLPRGWTVYSVGPNAQDDGGRVDNLSDIGVGPPPSAKT